MPYIVLCCVVLCCQVMSCPVIVSTLPATGRVTFRVFLPYSQSERNSKSAYVPPKAALIALTLGILYDLQIPTRVSAVSHIETAAATEAPRSQMQLCRAN